MPKTKSIVAMEKDYQARHDARTLAESMAIKKDRGRFNAAIKMAKPMASEMMEDAKMTMDRARAIDKIAKMKKKALGK